MVCHAWNEADIVCSNYLIEEHILSVGPFCCKLLYNPLRTDTMLCTQLLPKLKANYKEERVELVSVKLPCHCRATLSRVAG